MLSYLGICFKKWQIHESQPRLTIQPLVLSTRKEHINKLPTWSWCSLNFANHLVRIPVDKADCRAPPCGLKARKRISGSPTKHWQAGFQSPERALTTSSKGLFLRDILIYVITLEELRGTENIIHRKLVFKIEIILGWVQSILVTRD